MAENEEVVEIETGSNDTTQNQTQVAQRGTARSNTLPPNINFYLASFFTRQTPPARRTVSAEGGPACKDAREAGNAERSGYRGHASSGVRDGK